jgi:phosphatidylglycerol:prolipoprotein diacylglycerol transferase
MAPFAAPRKGRLDGNRRAAHSHAMFAIPFPVIDPTLVQIGPVAIRWYGLAYIAGLMLAWAYARALVRRDALWGGRPRPAAESLDDLLLYAAFGVILGGRLGHVLFYDPGHYLGHPLEIFALWQGGMAFHGGLLGAMAGMALFARRYQAPALTVFDLVAAGAPLGLLFGRLANFIKPELWGRPSDVPWAMVFPGAGPEPRHPSQLYEAGLEGLALFVLLALAIRAGALKRPGLVTGLFGLGYGLARIFCEFFREPDPDLEKLGQNLTMGMVLSAPMVVAGLALILFSLRRKEAAP